MEGWMSTNNKTLKNEIETMSNSLRKQDQVRTTNNKTLKNEIETKLANPFRTEGMPTTNNKTLKNEIETNTSSPSQMLQGEINGRLDVYQ